ncbi:MAG TPA: RodZ domain-containing protein [Nocardioides sp.]|uniref:RodZ domain-containing protein n=1 Tax=Nocardioides sp. TaxID=35761 RepID=UPI002E34AD55|nr:RodZ domain-containing protein [Nocardioides sp.]HEX5090099.1 RodZ domain-containing protein [Nocardioides sp.]
MTDLLGSDTEDLTGDLSGLVDTAERPAVPEVADGPRSTRGPDEPEADEVVIRRNGRVSVVLAAVSAVLAAAYFARAVTEFGHVVDWILCVGLTALTWAHVFSFLDSRMPLLVADSHGVRIRLGRTWRGMAWDDLEEIEYAPRRRLVRDGRLVLFPRNLDGELAMLGRAGRRHARVTDRMFGAPFALPLGLTTRVVGADGDLGGALVRLAAGRCEVVEVVPGAPEPESSDEDEAHSAELVEADANDGGEPDPTPEVVAPAAVVVASPTPSPLRDVRPAVRAEVSRDRDWEPEATQSVELPAIPHATSTFVIDDLAALEAVEPVIGPELKAARERLWLSIDQLAERTRIRPHVIEAIEIDDFAPCGGDFYARGHLRTLARVLGIDVAPLLKAYDDKYADAPIDPRRVFEAELATGRHGAIRGVRGGPNWSVIVAAVMTVVLAWSVARLVMDNPSTVSPASPSLADGSAGLTSGSTSVDAAKVPVVLTAAGGGAHVVVRDGTGKVVFTGSLAFGQSRTLQVSPPVRIQTTDGSLEVTVDGKSHGAVGRTGQPAQDVYTAR